MSLTRAGPKGYHGLVESVTTKRRRSSEDRRRELDTSLRKPRRILWAYCRHHGASYYFYGIETQSFKPSEAARWINEPSIRKVSGLCMECASVSMLYVGSDELNEHRYRPIDLCMCGLPHYHKNPTPQFLQQYNARPVPCRNGHTNV